MARALIGRGAALPAKEQSGLVSILATEGYLVPLGIAEFLIENGLAVPIAKRELRVLIAPEITGPTVEIPIRKAPARKSKKGPKKPK